MSDVDTDRHKVYYEFYCCVVSTFPAHRQILYVNAEGQLLAMLNALFISLKGGCVCTRDDSVSGGGGG